MSITSEDKQKIIKLLNLSTSESDGEALNAIRAANRIMKSYSLLWCSVIFESEFDAQRAEIFNKQKFIETMIERLVWETKIDGSALTKWERDFIYSVNEFFEDQNTITDKQFSVLEKIYIKMGFKK